MAEQRTPGRRPDEMGHTQPKPPKKAAQRTHEPAPPPPPIETPDPDQLNATTRINRRDQPRRYSRPGNPPQASPPAEDADDTDAGDE